MSKNLLMNVTEHILQTEKIGDEKALVLHSQLMGKYVEAFQKLEDDVLARLMAEDDSETLNLDEAEPYYGDQLCNTNN